MNELLAKLSSVDSHLYESCLEAVKLCAERQKDRLQEGLCKWSCLEPSDQAGRLLSELLCEPEPRVRLLMPEPREWERRSQPGLDLHFHCRRLADTMMMAYLPRLQAWDIHPDDADGEHCMDGWLCISASNASTKLDETVRTALIAAHCPPKNAERILQCLVRRQFARVHVIVLAQNEAEFQDASAQTLAWSQSYGKVHSVVALDGYDLTRKQLERLGLGLGKHLTPVQLLPASEDDLRRHYLHLIESRKVPNPKKGVQFVHGTKSGAAADRLANALLVLPAMQRILTLEKTGWHLKPGAQTFKDLLLQRHAAALPVVEHLEKQAKVASHSEMQQAFDDAIWESFHQHGGSFVPVLARGLNEICGIPVNIQIANYLVFVAWRCLNENDKLQLDKTGWPGNPSRQELGEALAGIKKLLLPETDSSELDPFYQTIRHALSDLFRRTEKQPDGNNTGDHGVIPQPRYWPSLLIAICQQPGGGPNKGLVDSFHRRLMAGAQPHALHVRLVHLVRPLRVRSIIDMVGGGVLEQALRDCGRRFRVVRSATPAVPPSRDHDAVSDLTVVEWTSSVDRSLILNFANPGNTEATPEEVSSLLSWLRGSEDSEQPPQSLLLIGVTDNEWWRTVLEQLLPRMRKNERVFLVTESNAVRDDLVARFDDHVSKSRLFVRVASHPDVLLYELYLRTTHTLPPAVHKYSFQHSMPPQPMPVAFDRQRDFEMRVEELVKVVKDDRYLTEWEKRQKAGENAPLNAQSGRHPDHPRLIWTHGRAGVTAVASRAYKELAHQGSRCIWLGLNDFGSSREVERYIVHQLSAMVGATPWASIALASHKPLEMFVDIITGYQQPLWPLAFDSSHWVVFIEARGIPGLDAGVCGHIPWDQKELLTLENDVILPLARRGVHVVYLPMSLKFAGNLASLMKTYSRSLYDQLELAHRQPEDIMPVGELLPPDLDPGESNEDSVENLIKGAIEWIRAGGDEEWRRTVFLYSLSLFRESRHLSAITTDAIHSPLDWLGRLFESQPAPRNNLPISLHEFATRTEPRYRKELRDLGIIRWQRGGFVHMPWLLREAVRQLLEHGREKGSEQEEVLLPRSPETGRPLTASKPAVHFRISEWYAEAYRSSSDPAALVECLYHRVMAVDGRAQAICPYADQAEPSKQVTRYRNMITLLSLVQLSKALRVTQSEARRHPELAFRLGENWAPGLITQLGLESDPPLIRAAGRQVEKDVQNLFRIVHKERGESYDEVVFKAREAASFPASAEVTQKMVKSSERRYEDERAQLCEMIATTVERMTPEGMTPMDLFDGSPWSKVRRVQEMLLEYCPFDHPERADVWQAGLHALAKYHYQLARNALLQAKKRAFDTSEEQGTDERGFRISRAPNDPAYLWLLEAIECAGIAHRISWLLPLEDLDFQLHVNLRASTSSCVAFARLGRFAEAHRVLNLASGYLRIMSARDSAIERGRLMLRRAEVFFLQAREKGIGRHNLHAHLHDALHWVRQGAACVLPSTQHGQWLNLALQLEAEIIQVCICEQVPMAGGEEAALGNRARLLELAARLVPDDPVACRRQEALRKSMEAWLGTKLQGPSGTLSGSS